MEPTLVLSVLGTLFGLRGLLSCCAAAAAPGVLRSAPAHREQAASRRWQPADRKELGWGGKGKSVSLEAWA